MNFTTIYGGPKPRRGQRIAVASSWGEVIHVIVDGTSLCGRVPPKQTLSRAQQMRLERGARKRARRGAKRTR